MTTRRKPKLFFETASQTDIGMLRSNNEDSLFTLDQRLSCESQFSSFGLYIIADGMGGHQGGEIASEIATRVISTTLLEKPTSQDEFHDPFSLLKAAIEKANKEIYEVASTKQELHSMGTTLTLCLRLDNELYIGHVGDSRAYLIRGEEIKQLTADHSIVAHLLKEGTITPEEARIHPDRGKIFRCLGVPGQVKVDTYYQNGKETELHLLDNDNLVLCSDGLTNHVTDKEIFSYVRTYQPAGQVCKKLIDLANWRGGGDNISVIVIKVSSKLNNNSVLKSGEG